MPRQRTNLECEVDISGFGAQVGPNTGADNTRSSVFKAVTRILKQQKAVASLAERRRFVTTLERAIRQRDVVAKLWSKITSGQDDIIALIQNAASSRDRDEAIWRCFLAAHFGRPSARGVRQVRSASRFLCAFRNQPFWTWKRVSKHPEALQEWLCECGDDLAALQFGNHRKYESQKPEHIWSVIMSFVSLANGYGSPSDLIAIDVDDADDGFDFLYRRLCPVKRFGRTGRFDFLVLLFDLGSISVEPRRPYLRGATGPLAGAKLLWGEQSPAALDDLAASVAEQLGVSPIVIEDALCNWQK